MGGWEDGWYLHEQVVGVGHHRVMALCVCVLCERFGGKVDEDEKPETDLYFPASRDEPRFAYGENVVSVCTIECSYATNL